jgi:hypothetical protein
VWCVTNAPTIENPSMELNFKKTYVFLISHTLPGLVFGIQIILAFKLFTNYDGFMFLYKIDYGAVNFIALLIILYVVSTLLGIILDAAHHYIFNKMEKKVNYDLFKFIKNKDQLELYIHIDEDYWYSYEAYANTALAMAPGILFLPLFLYRSGIPILFISIIIFFYILIIYILISEARTTLNIVFEIEKALMHNFNNNNRIDPVAAQNKNSDVSS